MEQLLKAPLWLIVLLLIGANILMVLDINGDLFISSIINSLGYVLFGYLSSCDRDDFTELPSEKG